jgi:Cu(I)/Ag(I) efflux system membrane fusion protein
MLANAGLVANVKPGAAISFEFVERKPGEYVVTRLEPRTGAAPAASGGKR